MARQMAKKPKSNDHRVRAVDLNAATRRLAEDISGQREIRASSSVPPEVLQQMQKRRLSARERQEVQDEANWESVQRRELMSFGLSEGAIGDAERLVERYVAYLDQSQKSLTAAQERDQFKQGQRAISDLLDWLGTMRPGALEQIALRAGGHPGAFVEPLARLHAALGVEIEDFVPDQGDRGVAAIARQILSQGVVELLNGSNSTLSPLDVQLLLERLHQIAQHYAPELVPSLKPEAARKRAGGALKSLKSTRKKSSTKRCD